MLASCVRACARTDCWDAAASLSTSQFPGVPRARQMGGGDARWRQPRTPAPASRCSTARPGEWRGCWGWHGLAWANRGEKGGWVFFLLSFFFETKRAAPKEPGMIEGKLSAVRGRAACGGTGAQAARKPEVWGLEGVHFRQPLAGQPLAEVPEALAPNLLQLLIECLVLPGSIPPAPGVERPGRARAGFPSPAQPGAASLRGCCILRAVLTLLPRTGGSSRAGMARNYSPCSL